MATEERQKEWWKPDIRRAPPLAVYRGVVVAVANKSVNILQTCRCACVSHVSSSHISCLETDQIYVVYRHECTRCSIKIASVYFQHCNSITTTYIAGFSGVARNLLPGEGDKAEGLRVGSPQRGPGAEPRWGSGGSPPTSRRQMLISSYDGGTCTHVQLNEIGFLFCELLTS